MLDGEVAQAQGLADFLATYNDPEIAGYRAAVGGRCSVPVSKPARSIWHTYCAKSFFACQANNSEKQWQLESWQQLWKQIEVQKQLQQDTT
jgi:hypothetical protein